MSKLVEVDKEIIESFKELELLTENFWDFPKVDSKEYSHGYHTYPAMMIPQVCRNLMEVFLKNQKNIKGIFDPFGGSGTTLVEGYLHGLNVKGTDLNPLSRLLMKVKTHPFKPELLDIGLRKFKEKLTEKLDKYENGQIHIKKPDFKNIDYWYKEDVIIDLQIVKETIKEVEDKDLQLFLWVAFSETVRYVSNARNGEFKIYRMAEEKLNKWKPETVKIFLQNLEKNQKRNIDFYNKSIEFKNKREVNVYNMNSMNLTEITDESVDLLITSPPYGDSKTTVAYGQFSRLSLQWLDFDDIGEDEEEQQNVHRIDTTLLGGKVEKELESTLSSKTLSEVLKKIKKKDEKRAKEVLQFYVDLDEVIKEVSRVMKKNSYQAWVVGNRTVKMETIQTDKIISELFDKYGVKHLITLERNIPTKRMPKSNSPTNVTGELSPTMNKEYMVILRKE